MMPGQVMRNSGVPSSTRRIRKFLLQGSVNGIGTVMSTRVHGEQTALVGEDEVAVVEIPGLELLENTENAARTVLRRRPPLHGVLSLAHWRRMASRKNPFSIRPELMNGMLLVRMSSRRAWVQN